MRNIHHPQAIISAALLTIACSGLISAENTTTISVLNSVTTAETLPTAPTTVTLILRSTVSLDIQWDDTAASQYVVQYKASSEVDFSLTPPVNGSSTTLSSLTPGETYNVKVAALNTAGINDMSDVFNFTTQPAVPSNLTHSISTRIISLTWTQDHVVEGFLLTCSPHIAGCSESGLRINNTAQRSQDLLNAIYGQSYSFTLKAFVTAADGGSQLSSDPKDLPSVQMPAGVPTGLNVDDAASSGTTVSLFWMEPADSVVQAYRIEWSTTDLPTVPVGTVNTSDNSSLHTVSTLSPGYGYDITVRSISPSGSESEPSAPPVKYTADPASVLNFTVVKNGSSLTFSWTAGDGRFDHFTTIFGSTSGGETTNQTSETTISYNDLLPNHEYEFKVRSEVNDSAADGTTKTSVYENTTATTDELSPGKVENLTLGEITASFVVVSWNLPESHNGLLVGYVVQAVKGDQCEKSIFYNCTMCERQPNATYDHIAGLRNCDNNTVRDLEVGLPQIKSNITNLTPFTDYTIKVWAINSKAPTEDSLTAKTLPTVPPVRPDISIFDYTNVTITVSWEEVSSEGVGDITGYTVIANSSEQGRQNVTLSPDHRNHTFEELRSYTNYTITVLASTSAGDGTPAEKHQRTLQSAPGKPDTLTLMPDKDAEGAFITVDWTKPTNENGVIDMYLIEWSLDGSTEKINATVNSNVTIYTISDNIKHFKNYDVSVSAHTVEEDGYGGWGPSKTKREMTLPDDPSGAPTDFTVSTTSSTAVLNWGPISPEKKNGDIVGYRVIYQANKGIHTNVKYISDGSTSVALENLQPYTEYKFTVQGYVIYIEQQLYGPNATKYMTTKPGPPEAPTITAAVKDQARVQDGVEKDRITFTLPTDVTTIFSVSSGPINQYQVLVYAGTSNKEQQRSGNTPANSNSNAATWADAKKKDFSVPYATMSSKSSPISWISARRKRAAGGEQVTVGDESCSDTGANYCNGPLESSTDYCIYLRGWTDGGYTDSECLVVEKTATDHTVTIIVVFVVAIVLVVVIGAIIILYRRRVGPFARDREKLEGGSDSPAVSPSAAGVAAVVPPSPPPQAVLQKNFIEHTDNMHRDQDFRFSQEYTKIKDMSPRHTHNAAVLGANTSKNRWVDILPFDHSRVKLLPADEEEGSDYINANYMPGYSSKREYIATQGPLPGTIDHFWRMAWEQNVTMIVMLAQLVERGRRKCEQYWPDNMEEPATYGDLVVTKRAESVLPEYTIRIFDIQMATRMRAVVMFHYTQWPDFGCPETCESMIDFITDIRQNFNKQNSSRGPIVVHCSAGVGRTGTYVAVDRLLQHIQDYDKVDIFNLVMEMRNYRCRMVQTENQYIYIHDCLKEALLKGMSRRFTPDPEPEKSDADEEVSEGGPIYENSEMQSLYPTSNNHAADTVDTEMVSLSVDVNGGESAPAMKNTEL